MALHADVSKKTPGQSGEARGQVPHIGDARMRDDQLHAGAALDEGVQVCGDRRQPAAAVDEDRHVVLDRELEHRHQPLVSERELLRPRMQLDAARPGVKAPLASAIGSSLDRGGRTG